MRGQDANRLAQAAAKAVTDDGAAEPLAGDKAVAVVFEVIRKASQDEQLVVPGPAPLEDGVEVFPAAQPKLFAH